MFLNTPPVLIVDDDDDMHLYCAKGFKVTSMRPCRPSNASTALEMLGRRRSIYCTDFHLGHRSSDWRGALVPSGCLGIWLMRLPMAAHSPFSVVSISAYGDQMWTT
jgi:hypothetical protein